MRDYQLGEHVHACIMPRGTVFLDLDRDAYSGIDANQSSALEDSVQGWPRQGSDPPVASKDSKQVVASLCEIGVLVGRSQRGRAHSSLAYDEPVEELRAWRDMRPVRVRARDVLTFFRALFTTLLMLHCRSMNAVAERAQRLSVASANSTVGIERAAELLTLYTYIRMLVFARRGRCLLDSLTLLEFLAARGVHARWIVGVRARPFSAHCWLQHRDRVLNGTPAFVRGFHPIFAT